MFMYYTSCSGWICGESEERVGRASYGGVDSTLTHVAQKNCTTSPGIYTQSIYPETSINLSVEVDTVSLTLDLFLST